MTVVSQHRLSKLSFTPPPPLTPDSLFLPPHLPPTPTSHPYPPGLSRPRSFSEDGSAATSALLCFRSGGQHRLGVAAGDHRGPLCRGLRLPARRPDGHRHRLPHLRHRRHRRPHHADLLWRTTGEGELGASDSDSSCRSSDRRRFSLRVGGREVGVKRWGSDEVYHNIVALCGHSWKNTQDVSN